MSLFWEASPIGGFPALKRLPWRSDSLGACLEARSLILDERSLKTAVRRYLNGMSADDIGRVTELSVEKSTHYKWFLGGDGNYRVWLHQYRSPDEYASTTGYAATIHNHRYAFCSRVVLGGLHTRSFRIVPISSVELFEAAFLDVGYTMLLTAADVHQVTAVESNTLTLVIQGPPERNFSSVWTAQGAFSRDIFDLDHLYGRLQLSLT